jgi:hypothetical protein
VHERDCWVAARDYSSGLRLQHIRRGGSCLGHRGADHVPYDSLAGARQVWRWAQQYRSQLTGPPLQQMTQLIAWLEGHIPTEDSDASVTRVSHGDYRRARHELIRFAGRRPRLCSPLKALSAAEQCSREGDSTYPNLAMRQNLVTRNKVRSLRGGA